MTDALIPEEALLQHIAFLGKTGAGKTTAAKGRVEELIRAGRRCCIVDPTGVWWGLRLAPDGESPGLPVVIFGGKRGDVPITDKDGAKVADTVAAGSFSSVIDTKGMTVGARTRFFTDFAQTLFQRNERPLHLVLDEAHVFAPQGKVPSPAAGAMLHAANELVSGGRTAGLRIMLLTQRPAKLHKDSLTQVETLVMMRLIAPQDRKAVKEWVGEWGDAGQGREIDAALPSLKIGAAYVWSPEVGFLELVRFPPATTFDSSRAPIEGDEDRRPPTLDELPLEAIRSAFAPSDGKTASNEEAKNNAPSAAALKAARADGYGEGFEAGRRAGSEEGHAEGVRVGISQALGELRPIISRLEELAYGESYAPVDTGGPSTPREPIEVTPYTGPAFIRGEKAPERPQGAKVVPLRATGAPEGVTRPQAAILDAIAWAETLLSGEAFDRTIIAFLAGASPKASGYQNNLGALRSGGYIDYPSPGLLQLTTRGRQTAAAPARPPNREDLLAAIMAKLPRPQADILWNLWSAYPEPKSREEVANSVDKSSRASGFQNDLGRLRSLGLITYPEAGFVCAADHLFN